MEFLNQAQEAIKAVLDEAKVARAGLLGEAQDIADAFSNLHDREMRARQLLEGRSPIHVPMYNRSPVRGGRPVSTYAKKAPVDNLIKAIDVDAVNAEKAAVDTELEALNKQRTKNSTEQYEVNEQIDILSKAYVYLGVPDSMVIRLLSDRERAEDTF